jgi:hypothetical protein
MKCAIVIKMAKSNNLMQFSMTYFREIKILMSLIRNLYNSRSKIFIYIKNDQY